MSALAALEAAYAAHLLTAPVWPTHGVRWPVPHADACDCAACDEYRAHMREWGARERELAEACTAAEVHCSATLLAGRVTVSFRVRDVLGESVAITGEGATLDAAAVDALRKAGLR